MKPHIPLPLLAAVLTAITAPCALADTYNNVTYQASGGRSTGDATNVTITDNGSNAPRGERSADNGHGLTFDLASYTGTLSLEGSGGSLASSYDNGGYGGRFGLTNSTGADVTGLTVKISGGTEVSMGTVLENSATAPQIVADNASFFTGSGTIAANIKVDAGGLRLNGGSGTTYAFSGAITGSGDFSTCLGGTGSSIFTGDVSQFKGTWLNNSEASTVRTIQFGNGSACSNNSVGGNFGQEDRRIQAKFNYTGDYSITGSVYASTLTITSGNATFSGTVDATTLTINSTAVFSGTVSADTITIANSGSFSLSGTGVYALNGKTVSALTVGGNGTISISGTNTFNETLTANGSQITIADGTVFSSSSLGTLTTIDESNATYSDSISGSQVNGYASGIQYVLISNTSVADNQTLSSYSTAGGLEGTTIKLLAGTGLVAETLSGGGAYYVNSGTVVYGSSNNSAAADSTTALILASGATLELAQALAENVHLTTHGGTIQVNEVNGEKITLLFSDVTATAATELTGSGNYQVTSNSLGNNIRLKAGTGGWKGTVTLSGYNGGSTARDFSRLVNGTTSTLELKGFTGWTNHWSGTESINFKLENNGSSPAWTNGATAGTRKTCTFTGKFSGTGTFKMTGANQSYTFSGDISEWTGQFIKDTTDTNAQRTTYLTFQGGATDVKIAISLANKSTLHVVAGETGLTSGKDITFHNDITNVTSLEVNTNVNASLEGSVTTGTLTLNAGATATLSGEGKVTLGTERAPGRLSFEVLDKNAPSVATLAGGETEETPAPAPTGSIQNGSNAAGAVSFSDTAAGSADTTYNNIKIKANSSTAFALLGTLNNSAVENNNTGAITVNAPGAGGSIAGLYANKGDIIVSTTELHEAVSVGVLFIAQGTNISIAGQDTGVGTFETGNVMTGVNADAASSPATLTANLVVSDKATLTLPIALDLGGNTLTFEGGIASLSTTYSDDLSTLLFSNAGSVTFGTDIYNVEGGKIMLNGAEVDDQVNGVLLNGSVVGLGGNILLNVAGGSTSGVLNVTYTVPEPSTATLGLLALAGLCLRRRRK